jgi:hypothetical protein
VGIKLILNTICDSRKRASSNSQCPAVPVISTRTAVAVIPALQLRRLYAMVADWSPEPEAQRWISLAFYGRTLYKGIRFTNKSIALRS